MNRLLAKYILGEATGDEQARVERWLARSPARREEMERLRERLDLATRRYRPGAFDARSALARVIAPRRLALLARRSVAAAAILLLAGAAWYLLSPADPREITIAARDGEVEVHLLPDGSRVTLSGPASLAYRPGFDRATREITAASGTLYFEVEGAPHRPFIVSTALLAARVLGTTFQVESGDERAAVLVKEGRVEVTATGGSAREILTAGMSATRLAGQPGLAVTSSFDANRLSWKTGEFTFDGVPLREVIALLERHFRVSIPLPAALAAERLTVSFHRPTLAEALDVINQTLDSSLVAE
ncbi:MAG: FecR domain-containing protein [Odoribacteraceae bacterium]|nr:FecR domain-containing protein [Odoribacteraceae bacterium]